MAVTTEKKSKIKKKKYVETVGIVSKMIRETPDTQTLRIKMPNLKPEDTPFKFKPGQFVMVRPEINGRIVPRAYSVSSSPFRSKQKDGYIDLTVRQTDNPTVSKWLNDRKVGDEILFRGPYGHFLWNPNDPKAEQVFMLGGGSGVTPLKSILEYIHDKKFPNKVKLLYSVRTFVDLISYEVLKQMCINSENAEVNITLTREPQESDWKGRRGRINLEWIKEELEDFDLEKTKCFLCGIPNFVDNMKQLLLEAGFTKERILHEKWD
ncbi:MAG: ferredoxin--NADP reductase [Candidatus Hodarchaeales archaeon]